MILSHRNPRLKARQVRCFALAALVLPALPGLLPGAARAQQDQPQGAGLSSRVALNHLQSRYGVAGFRELVAMRGVKGQSQPARWEVTIMDKTSSNLTRTFTVDEFGNTQHVGPQVEFYRDIFPDGFVDLADVLLDSQAVFAQVEEEARRVRVGFDSLSYLLKARELTNEPIWVVELREADGRLAGSVTVSALTGKQLRSVWFGWKPKPAGGVEAAIHDSLIEQRALSGEAEAVATTPGPAQTNLSPPGTPAMRYGGTVATVPPAAVSPQAQAQAPRVTLPAASPPALPRPRTPATGGTVTRIPPPPIPATGVPAISRAPLEPDEVDTSIPPPPPVP